MPPPKKCKKRVIRDLLGFLECALLREFDPSIGVFSAARSMSERYVIDRQDFRKEWAVAWLQRAWVMWGRRVEELMKLLGEGLYKLWSSRKSGHSTFLQRIERVLYSERDLCHISIAPPSESTSPALKHGIVILDIKVRRRNHMYKITMSSKEGCGQH